MNNNICTCICENISSPRHLWMKSSNSISNGQGYSLLYKILIRRTYCYKSIQFFTEKILILTYLLLHLGDMMFETTELSRLWAIPNPSIITESENKIKVALKQKKLRNLDMFKNILISCRKFCIKNFVSFLFSLFCY